MLDTGEHAVDAWIALGANLGDRAANIQRALDLLDGIAGIAVVSVSSFLDNPAVGGPPGAPPFLNAAATLRTTLSPHDLMHALLQVEARMGRERKERWGPRLIDLDLLSYSDRVIDEAGLTLPHPRLHEREFVLIPLSEIAPLWEHPVLRQNPGQLRNLLKSKSNSAS